MNGLENPSEFPLEKFVEETDLMERSSKKVKIRDVEPGTTEVNNQQERDREEEPRRKISYREKLMGGLPSDTEMDDQEMEADFYSDEDSEQKDDEEEEDYPTIKL